MSPRKIDYNVLIFNLKQVATEYDEEATAITDIISRIDSINSKCSEIGTFGELPKFFEEFLERYEHEYKRELQSLQCVLEHVSHNVMECSRAIENIQSDGNNQDGGNNLNEIVP